MADANLHQTRFADYVEIFNDLDSAGSRATIVGGQAVNFWAELFQADEPEIRNFRPFTSTDLDLHGLDSAGTKVLKSRSNDTERERDPFGKAFTIVSHTFGVQTKRGQILPVQALKSVPGLRPPEIRKSVMLLEAEGIRVAVLSPIACLKAKMYNVRTLDQRNRQDEKHVRVLVPCVRALIHRLLREAETSGNYRRVLNALNQVLSMTVERNFLKTARDLKLDLNHLVPSNDLRASTHPKIQNFVTKLFPRWQKQISETLL